MATTEVLLTENVPGLGAEADIIKVKAGYARNYLLPGGKALEVTPITLKKINMLKAKRAEREAKELNESDELSRRINKIKMTLTLETGESGKAFGAITAADIAARLKTDLGQEIDRHRIVLEHPIKSTGSFEVPIKLHSEVTAKLNLVVKSSRQEEEGAAEAQPAAEAPAEEKGFRAKVRAKHRE